MAVNCKSQFSNIVLIATLTTRYTPITRFLKFILGLTQEKLELMPTLALHYFISIIKIMKYETNIVMNKFIILNRTPYLRLTVDKGRCLNVNRI